MAGLCRIRVAFVLLCLFGTVMSCVYDSDCPGYDNYCCQGTRTCCSINGGYTSYTYSTHTVLTPAAIAFIVVGSVGGPVIFICICCCIVRSCRARETVVRVPAQTQPTVTVVSNNSQMANTGMSWSPMGGVAYPSPYGPPPQQMPPYAYSNLAYPPAAMPQPPPYPSNQDYPPAPGKT